MSIFGWGIGDVRNLVSDVYTVVQAVRAGPEKYRQISREADSLYQSLEDLQRNVIQGQQWTPKAQARMGGLQAVVDNCAESLGEVWDFLAKNRIARFPNSPQSQKVRSMVARYRVGVKDVKDIQLRFISQQQAISRFIQNLNTGTLNEVHQSVRNIESYSQTNASTSAPLQIQNLFLFNQPHFNYQPSFSSAPSGPQHEAICDGDACGGSPIRGIRYQCVQCNNFDYCEVCIRNARSTHNPRHTFHSLLGPNERGKSGNRIMELEDGFGSEPNEAIFIQRRGEGFPHYQYN
jgi:hypothetical protein